MPESLICVERKISYSLVIAEKILISRQKFLKSKPKFGDILMP